MTTVSTSPLAVRIRAVLDEKSMLKHPFYQAWTRGELPLERMREYARQYYHFEAAFPRLLERYPRAHGITGDPAGRCSITSGTRSTAPRNHPALWLEFAAALGLSADEVTGATLRPADDGADRPLRGRRRARRRSARRWPRSSRTRARCPDRLAEDQGAQRFLRLQPAQFEFFSVHLVADMAHAGARRWRPSSRALNDDDARHRGHNTSPATACCVSSTAATRGWPPDG